MSKSSNMNNCLPPLIKVCGMTCQEDVSFAEALSFSFVGFIFAPKSPRYISPEQAGEIVSHTIHRVGVFVDTPVSEILSTLSIARLNFVQLHGDYSFEDCEKIGKERVIKVFWPERYTTRERFIHDMDLFSPVAAFFLFDAGQRGGGSGQVFSWEVLSDIAIPQPFFVAGGLAPENIDLVMRILPKATGVDVNSGVELTPGKKDVQKMILLQKICKN